MPAVTHARTIAILTLFGAAHAPATAQTDIGTRTIAAADMRGDRVDRSIVSPFSVTRRIVVRPGPDGGSEVVAVGADFDARVQAMPVRTAPIQPASVQAAPVRAAPNYVPVLATPLVSAAPTVPPAAQFIDIGPLDAVTAPEQPAPAALPAGLIGTPCRDDCPDQRVEFSDIQPYYGTTAPPSSFSPD